MTRPALHDQHVDGGHDVGERGFGNNNTIEGIGDLKNGVGSTEEGEVRRHLPLRAHNVDLPSRVLVKQGVDTLSRVS